MTIVKANKLLLPNKDLNITERKYNLMILYSLR